MTQQDIVLGLIRAIIIIVFGLNVVSNFINLIFNNKTDSFTDFLALVIGLTIIYFAWTL